MVLSFVTRFRTCGIAGQANILSSVCHPNIVSLKGVCKEPPCLLTEWCSRGSLLDILKQAQSSTALQHELTWPLRLRMALQIAKVNLVPIPALGLSLLDV